MQKIVALSYEIKDLLDKNPEVVLLSKVEKEMENSEEAMRLSYNKDIKELNYNDALKHFKEDSNEVKKAQKELYEAKKELESLDVVRRYLSSYKRVRVLYEKINSILFDDFKTKLCEK